MCAIRNFSSKSTDTLLDLIPTAPTELTSAKESAIEFPPSDEELKLIVEWERVRSSAVPERGMLLAAESAINIYLRSARLRDAQETSRSLVEVARRLLQSSGETPVSLRDVSISPNNVGHVARALSR